jgi:hypothetical protein
LNLIYDELRSIAFDFSLCRYTMVAENVEGTAAQLQWLGGAD